MASALPSYQNQNQMTDYTPEEREALGRAMAERVDEDVASEYINIGEIMYKTIIIQPIQRVMFDEKLGWFRLKSEEELAEGK